MSPRSNTLKLTDYAAELGYDVALVRTPFYYKKQMQPANILAFYRTVADRSPLPVMIYSVPPFTGYDMPAELVIELADHPNIDRHQGIERRRGKSPSHGRGHTAREAQRHGHRNLRRGHASHAESAQARATETAGELVTLGGGGAPTKPSSAAVSVVAGLKTRQKEVGFQVLVGAAQTLEPSLHAGAVGAILAFADAAPTACYEIYAAWKEGDIELARLKQARIAKAAQRVVGELGIPGIKHAMDFNGYFGGPVRLPLLPLTADLKAEVEQLMADIRN